MRQSAFPSILLTSFQVWRPDQISNSSDDLLQIVAATYPRIATLRFLRRVPVHFDLAPRQVIGTIESERPAAVICCGMGEPRRRLGLESSAVNPEGRKLRSPLPLTLLSQDLRATEISHDAGSFVCNCLYYEVLNYLQTSSIPGLFVHVPRLTPQNTQAIASDFMQVLERMHQRIEHRPPHWVDPPRSALSA